MRHAAEGPGGRATGQAPGRVEAPNVRGVRGHGVRRAVRRAIARRPLDDVRWASPQLLLTGFLFVVALAYALTGSPQRLAPSPPLAVDPARPDLRPVEVRYVVVDALGLERPGYADVGLPPHAVDDPNARLTAALSALHVDLRATGAWPEAVGPPAGFVLELDRRRLAVVDVSAVPADVGVDVADEWAAVRSLVATARAAVAADEVIITVDGQERPSMWGRVALTAP
jgi:hypothetical protein